MTKFRDDYYVNQELERKLRLDRKLKSKVLDFLSTYDYQKTYTQIHKECVPGTSAWICESPNFRDWISGTSKTLWFTGRCKYTAVSNMQWHDLSENQ